VMDVLAAGVRSDILSVLLETGRARKDVRTPDTIRLSIPPGRGHGPLQRGPRFGCAVRVDFSTGGFEYGQSSL
jgi:hypothetical protein